MYRKYFKEVLDLHQKWATGTLYKRVIQDKTATIILSDIPGEYYNFAIPTVTEPERLDLNSVEKLLKTAGRKLSIFLLEEHLKAGFVEYLIRKGLVFDDRDSWMGYDPETYLDKKVNSKIINVTPENFADYNSVLGKVFSDFPGNKTYMKILEKTVSGELKSDFPGLKSDLYIIYDNGKPASGAAMFYSKEENFAYLHDAGTLKEFRGKGYQTDLIRYRVNKAISLGVDRIYTSVTQGSISWSNFIKCGLNEMHTGFILLKK